MACRLPRLNMWYPRLAHAPAPVHGGKVASQAKRMALEALLPCGRFREKSAPLASFYCHHNGPTS